MKKVIPALVFGAIIFTSVNSSAIVTTSYQNCGIKNDQAGCSQTSATDWGLFSKKTDYAKTKYPLVFAHGLFGFSQIGPVNYWDRIPQDLSRQGANVFVTNTSSANSDAVRGEQLLKQVLTIQALTGAEKVNLIGHSQGVQTVRYVAGVRPDLIASVTGIAGSNKGSPVADLVETLVRKPASVIGFDKTIGAVINMFTGIESFLGGTSSNGGAYDQDVLSALAGLTKAGAGEFTATLPQGIPVTEWGSGGATGKGVNYYSWSGKGGLTNLLDPTAYGLLAGEAFIKLSTGSDSDGLVPVCSSHLGNVIRDNYPQNHLDEINQILGLAGSGAGADPVPLYSQHANRLKLAGF